MKIGIALSGGGSRAMAFHLGCLRTLHHLGILQRASVLSTVSGGSVIGAMYMVHEGSFEEFEVKVRTALAKGFLWPALGIAIKTTEGVRASLCFGLLAGVATALLPVRSLGWLARKTVKGRLGDLNFVAERWVPRRFASRTTILRRTFDARLFRGRTLGSLPSTGPSWIAVATELRTRSAFYFGRRDAGSWRVGQMDPSETLVAHAVAASAAYPLFLPALDECPIVRKRDGSLANERVTLTDGGVYDNLGLAPLWPDRDPQISIGVRKVDIIVACRAGYGLRKANPITFVGGRMSAAFGSIFDRVQNASTTRLFDLQAAGRIAGFALPYLDQDDKKLKFPPPDLVSRASVAGYPTDFSAMPPEWIERLSKRGEQLTLAVIREHLPDMLHDDRRSGDAAGQPAQLTSAS